MSKIDRFGELIAWQKARHLAKAVYTSTRRDGFSRDLGLSNQIQRAAVSIMANIAEGFERGRRAEFHQFLSTAKASCAETGSHLYVALDIGYLKQEEFERLLRQAEEVGRVVGGLRSAVQKQKDIQLNKSKRLGEVSLVITQFSAPIPDHRFGSALSTQLSALSPQYAARSPRHSVLSPLKVEAQ